jgi:hypothetical protein
MFESGKGRCLFPFRELPPRVVEDPPRGCDEGGGEADLNEDVEGEAIESVGDAGQRGSSQRLERKNVVPRGPPLAEGQRVV